MLKFTDCDGDVMRVEMYGEGSGELTFRMPDDPEAIYGGKAVVLTAGALRRLQREIEKALKDDEGSTTWTDEEE